MIDINFPAPVITQYSILEKVCPNCGHTVCSEFPEGVNGDVFYGPNVQARLYIFVKSTLYHTSVSKGS